MVGVCRAENAPLALRLGCHRVVDYKSEPYLERERDFDVVFDTIGKESARASRLLLGRRGVYVTTVPSPAAFFSLGLSRLWPFARRTRVSLVRSRRADLELFARWAAEGRLQVALDRQLPLARAAELHDYMRTFRSRGKNVLLVS